MLFPVPTLRHRLELNLLKSVLIFRHVTQTTVGRVYPHRRKIAATVGAIVVAALIVVTHHGIVTRLAAISKGILKYAESHPNLLRALHVTLYSVPDVAYLLLAFAGLSYLMPGFAKKIEETTSLRWVVVAVFVTFGIATIILNAVSREDQEHERHVQETKMDRVRQSVDSIQTRLTTTKGQTNEAERRKQLLEALRDEYVISTPDAPATMLTGNSYPPTEWMRKRLHEIGETWAYLPDKAAPKARTFGPIPISTPAPTEKAHVEFSFFTEDPDQLPIKSVIAETDSPFITVNIVFYATGEVTAKTGQIWLRICNGCRYAEEPAGFLPPDPDAPDDRSMRFTDLYPMVLSSKISLKIFPPIIQPRRNDRMAIGGYYSCENCPPVDPKHGDELVVLYPRRGPK
jgi:hypothetical protein